MAYGLRTKGLILLGIPSVILLMPTLNEEDGLREVLGEVTKLSFDIRPVIVDGLSADSTREVAAKHDCKILLETRKGYGYAMKSGLEYLKDYPDEAILVTMDADGTYWTGDILKLVTPLCEGSADFTNGNRLELAGYNKSMGLKQRLGNRLISWIANVCLKLGVRDTQSGMKALTIRLAKRLEVETDGINWQIAFIAAAKRKDARILEVPINYGTRIGEKKLGRVKDGLHEAYSIVKVLTQ